MTRYSRGGCGVASLVVFLPRAWDVIIAPVVGSMSDKTMVRTGSRAKWLLIGGLILAPMFALTFAAPGGGGQRRCASWVGVFFCSRSRASPRSR